MVVEVLKKNQERKGTSVQAIRNKILAAHPSVDPLRLKFLLRSALNKGIEKGILTRPLNSSATGATGRFKLAKPVKKTNDKEGKMSENVDPNVGGKTEEKKPQKKTAKAAKGEKPKPADKSKKDADGKPDKVVAPAKKAKAKIEEAKDGGNKTAKEPGKTKETKGSTSKATKDSAEANASKTSKKGKK
ncbi:histone H1.8 [Rhinophrynus dorsalis]